ncbi:cytochrome P450 [Xylaria sp. FL0933]|nr:cytochrome P450 [Xylaria sp. FL0933]
MMPFFSYPLAPSSRFLGGQSNLVDMIVLTFILIMILRSFVRYKHTLLPNVPVAGKRWRLEPSIITRYRYVFDGWAVTKDGWEKHKNSIFSILRPDSNVTVLPLRYVDQLQNLPDHILHPIEALSAVTYSKLSTSQMPTLIFIKDMHGKYTGMNILLGTHLSFNVVRNKLTPKLGSIIPLLAEELEYALSVEIPPCRGEWVSADLNTIMTRIISRLTSRTWVGLPLCRNEDWHSANVYTTSQIFYTALMLKCLPVFLHSAVGALSPTRRKLKQGLRRVASHLIPLIEMRKSQKSGEGLSEKCPEDVLQWMIDTAEGEEQSPENLALRYTFTVIGSLYTVSAGLVDCMYDLAAHPEYMQLLRDEVRQALEAEGGWHKSTLSKLVHMDSFMKESQRVNAPSPISFKRIVKQQIVLSDGVTLPVGTYVSVVNTSTLEGQVGVIGDEFDGLRYSRMRQQTGGIGTRHQYSSTDKQHITFGHGRFACPGRFVAAAEIKMVLGFMLERYEIKFHEGCHRPKNLQLLELGFQDPSIRVYLRERKDS